MNLNASLDEINFNAKQLALNLLNQNQFVEAEFFLDKVFTLNEHDLDFLHICRIVKYKLNKIEEVIFIFDKIIKLDESAENYNDKGLCFKLSKMNY